MPHKNSVADTKAAELFAIVDALLATAPPEVDRGFVRDGLAPVIRELAEAFAIRSEVLDHEAAKAGKVGKGGKGKKAKAESDDDPLAKRLRYATPMQRFRYQFCKDRIAKPPTLPPPQTDVVATWFGGVSTKAEYLADWEKALETAIEELPRHPIPTVEVALVDPQSFVYFRDTVQGELVTLGPQDVKGHLSVIVARWQEVKAGISGFHENWVNRWCCHHPITGRWLQTVKWQVGFKAMVEEAERLATPPAGGFVSELREGLEGPASNHPPLADLPSREEFAKWKVLWEEKRSLLRWCANSRPNAIPRGYWLQLENFESYTRQQAQQSASLPPLDPVSIDGMRISTLAELRAEFENNPPADPSWQIAYRDAFPRSGDEATLLRSSKAEPKPHKHSYPMGVVVPEPSSPWKDAAFRVEVAITPELLQRFAPRKKPYSERVCIYIATTLTEEFGFREVSLESQITARLKDKYLDENTDSFDEFKTIKPQSRVFSITVDPYVLGEVTTSLPEEYNSPQRCKEVADWLAENLFQSDLGGFDLLAEAIEETEEHSEEREDNPSSGGLSVQSLALGAGIGALGLLAYNHFRKAN